MPFLPPSAARCRALRCGVAALAILAVPAGAQDRTPDGRLLTLGVSLGLQASDNPDLDDDGEARGDATIGLNLTYEDATPTETFRANTDFNLSASTGGDPDDDTYEVSDPRASFLYSRLVNAGTTLRFDGSLSRTEITSITPFDAIEAGEELDDEDIEEILEGDDVDDEATRLRFDVGAALETGQTGPVGLTYALGIDGVRLDDEVPDTLEEETNLTGGIGLRADLTPVLALTSDLSFATLDEDRIAFETDLTRRFGAAGASVGLAVVSDDGRVRSTLSFGGGIERPFGVLRGSAGVIRIDSGDTDIVGTASAAFALPNGELNFDFARRVSQVDLIDGADDDETLRRLTVASASWDRDLTRFWQFGLDASYTMIDGINGGDEETFGRIGANLSRPLTDRWNLSLGYSHRFENDESGTEDSNTVTISLNRVLDLTF